MSRSSLHVTVGVLATTMHEVVRRVAAMAADVPALRRPLPPGWADDQAIGEQAVKDGLVELVRMIEGIEPGEVVEHLARGFRARRAPDERGRLNDLDRLVSLSATDRVRPRPDVPRTILEAGERMRIVTGPRTIDLPAEIAPAVSRLLDGRATTARELGDLLDDASALVLVRRLVREGLLALADQSGDSGA
jgi:lysine-specific demethylase/histidyl-hydroxylase NO66